MGVFVTSEGADGLLYARPRVNHPRGQERAPVRESREWLAALRGPAPVRSRAWSELHALLLRGARFELGRRRSSLAHVPSGELDDLAMQAADDAMVAILANLDTFRGESRFTTWAYKFVLLEAGVKARRRAWQGREITLEDDAWSVIADAGPSVHQLFEDAETLRAIQVAVQSSLTKRQRVVFVALALNDVPIDVLAERLQTTRGALYKALHDARRKLRAVLAEDASVTDTVTIAAGEHDQ
jgi:RNA polymerase sigma-70 factor, ECF subfamily